MSSETRDFGPNDNTTISKPSSTGTTGSTGSYGNTHSSTSRSNPIHPSDPQSTAHPAYGNSTFSSPYETGGGNTGQRDGEGAGFTATSTGQGAGVGRPIHAGGHGGLGQEYHDNVDAAYSHATGREPPEGYESNVGQEKGPYDTGGGNSAQAGGAGATNMSGTQPSAQTGTTSSGAGASTGATTAVEAVPHTGYRAQPYSSGNAAASSNTTDTTENRSTGAKVKEMAHGVKGLFAAVHGAGESARGTFNAGVDQTFNAADGEEKNRALAADGKQEMDTGMFSERTKAREGVVPADSDLKRNREFSAPNTTEQRGPSVSTNYNNVERVPASESSSGGNGNGGIKGVVAAVHGIGEKVRGTFNKGVDDAAHDSAGSQKNSAVANAGDNEMATGKFAASTKDREGLLPGSDHGQRHAQANTDLNRE